MDPYSKQTKYIYIKTKVSFGGYTLPCVACALTLFSYQYNLNYNSSATSYYFLFYFYFKYNYFIGTFLS